MTTSKNTKKALLASVLSMLLCVAMLVGSTFAWFTDTASAAVNKIQAGTLDVALEMKEGDDWVNAEGKTLAWVDKDESTLWEPNCTYNLESFKIVNKGNLALKYKIVVSGIQGDVKLNEAIDWSMTDGSSFMDFDTGYSLASGEESAPITITGHMKETAGNEYQGLSIDGIAVTVVATQDTVEYDSTNNTYDANAAYPEVETANDATSFADALVGIDQSSSNKNVSITVTQDLEQITGIKTAAGNDLAVDFGGHTVTVANTVGSAGTETNGMQLLKDSDVILKNGTYKPANTGVRILIQNYSDLTLENVTLDSTDGSGDCYALSNNHGYIVLKGNTNIITKSGQVAFDSCKFSSYEIPTVVIDESMTGTVDGKIEMTGGNLIVKGGTFKNTGMELEKFKSYVADGYTVTVNTDGSWIVGK